MSNTDKNLLVKGRSSQSGTRAGIRSNYKTQDSLRSLTRLAIGGLSLGVSGLRQKMREWENETVQNIADDQFRQIPESQIEVADYSPVGPQPAETSTRQARYAVIGLIFSVERVFQSGFRTAGRIERDLARSARPVTRRLRSNRLLAPFRKRYQRLVDRGEKEVNRWIALGRVEDQRSQELAKVAFDKTNDMYLGYLASNPEVRELVQTQSTGFVTEFVEEVRERTVSADTLLEAITRSILRKTPRSALPAPPPNVQRQAAIIHPQAEPKEIE